MVWKQWILLLAAVGCGNSNPSAPHRGSGGGSNERVLPSDAARSRVPEGGYYFVVLRGGSFAIAKLLDDHVEVVRDAGPLSESGLSGVGWLDERTVVVLADGIVATVTVDGTRTEVAKLDQSYDTLVVTQAGEAWAARCAEPPERRKPGPCNQEFLRVIPAPQAQSVKAPEGIVPHRVMRGSDELVRIPFKEVAAPAGVELHQIPLSSPKGFIVTGISCTSPGGSSKFPDVAALPAMGYAASESRWVLEKPPIYQVVAATQHRSHTAVQVNYFRPCEARPLDGFYAFGDGVWAEYLATRDHGTWTFRVEDKVIGTVSGSAGLRPNHDVSP